MEGTKSRYDQIVNGISMLCLAGIACYLVFYWKEIPEVIPGHYNAQGEIDRWTMKKELLMLPILNVILFGILSIIEKVPQMWNTGVKVTEENKDRVYGIMKSMLITMKTLMVMMLSMLTIWMSMAKRLPYLYLPVAVATIVGVMICFVVKLRRSAIPK